MIPPEIDVATLPTREEILADAELPKVRPLFVGIQRRLAERRLRGLDVRIERAARSNAIRRHVGESVLRGVQGTNFRDPGDPLRPDGIWEPMVARHLERTRRARDMRQGPSYKAARRYMIDQTQPDKPQFDQPDFDRPGVNRTFAEQRQDAKTARYHGRLQGEINRRDEHMTSVINAPYRRAMRLIDKRAELTAKHEALTRHISLRQAKRLLGFNRREGSNWKVLGQDVKAKEAARTLQAAVREHTLEPVLAAADDTARTYVNLAAALGMEPAEHNFDRARVLRALVAEYGHAQQPDSPAAREGRIALTDPFADSAEARAEHDDVAARLIGLQFIDSAYRQEAERYVSNDAFIGSLSVSSFNEKILEVGLRCFANFQEGKPVSMAHIARIGHFLRAAVEDQFNQDPYTA